MDGAAAMLAEGSMLSGRRGTSEAHAGVAGARGWLVGFQRVACHDQRLEMFWSRILRRLVLLDEPPGLSIDE